MDGTAGRTLQSWSPLVAGIVLLAVAYAGDRLIVAVAQNAGSFPEWSSSVQWSVLDRVTRLVAVVAAGALAWMATIGPPRPRVVGVIMLAVGLYFSVAINVGFIFRPSVELPLRLDLHWPAYLVLWVSTAVAVLGALLAARPSVPSWANGKGRALPWIRAAAVVPLIAIAYMADAAIERDFQQATTGIIAPLMIVDILARFGVVIALLALAWSVLRGPRRRLVGGTLLAIGLYVTLVPAIGHFLLTHPTSPISVPGVDLLPNPAYVVRWASTSIAVLGCIELVWPPVGAREAPRPALAEPAAG